jgi:ornithine cyclodeaminase/alanine dehydrogenase-like protein (mu-crystallin family)
MMSGMLLYEADTDALRAMVDTEYITTLRTGASTANSAFLFTKSNFKTVGLIGLGNIMSACVGMFIKRTKDRPLIYKALQAS